MGDAYKEPNITNIFETGGIFFEFFKTIPKWLSKIPLVGWSLDWVAFFLIRILSILGIPVRILLLAFTDTQRFLKIIGDFFAGLMDKLTLFTNWSVLKFILWSCIIFIIVCFIPFRNFLKNFNDLNKVSGIYIGLLAFFFIIIPIKLSWDIGFSEMFNKMSQWIKDFPTGTKITPGYFWPNLLFWIILLFMPLIKLISGIQINHEGKFNCPVNNDFMTPLTQILYGILNLFGGFFNNPIFSSIFSFVIIVYYTIINLLDFKVTAYNIVAKLVPTLILVGLILFSLYKIIYRDAAAAAAALNIFNDVLLISFFTSILLFLLNLLVKFVPELPGIPVISQIISIFIFWVIFFISFMLISGIQKISEDNFINYVMSNKYKFWGLFSSFLFILNYFLNDMRSKKYQFDFENKKRECEEDLKKKQNDISENKTEESGLYIRCMKEAKENGKKDKNFSITTMVLLFIFMLFGGILLDVKRFCTICNSDNFILFLFNLLIILLFCFIVFQWYSEKYNEKVNEKGETINQKNETDDIILKDAYAIGNFIFTAAAALIILSLVGSIGGIRIGKMDYNKNYSWSEKMSWLNKIRSRIFKLLLYGFSFYTFFYFIGKTFNSTFDNSIFNNIVLILGGGLLLSLVYVFGDKIFPNTGFSRILFNMILIIPCLCQFLFTVISQDIKNTPPTIYLILLVEMVLISIYMLTSIIGRFYVEDYFITRNSKTDFNITGSTIRQHGDNTCNKKHVNKGVTGNIVNSKKGSIEKTIKILDNPQYLDKETTPGYVLRNNKPGDELCMKQTYRHPHVKTTVIKPINLDKKCEFFTLDNLMKRDISVEQNYNYALSFWTFFHTQSSGFRESYKKYTNLLDFGSYPIIDYNISTDTLRVRIGIKLPEKCKTLNNRNICCDKKKAKKKVNNKNLKGNELKMIELWCRENMTIDENNKDEHLITVFEKEGILKRQKWNNIVINYDLGVLDIFVNSKLVGTWKNIVSYQSSKKIILGEFDGIAGGICNVMYYPSAINLFQIKKHYELLKKKSPPLI
jgi:hypothetical protein